MLTKTTTPYEFLARWTDGVFAGAHVGFIETIKDGDEVLTSKALPVQPVGAGGFPLADIMGQLQADALTALETANTAKAAAEAERDAAKAEAQSAKDAQTAAESARDAAIAERDALIAQHATVDADGVPNQVTKRQGKTLMELTPHPAGNLWTAALAAIDAMTDATQRVIMRNYLIDSQVYERERVRQMATALFGMTPEQADQMMVAAAKL